MWELYEHCEPLIRSVAESCLRSVGLVPDGTMLSLAALVGMALVGSLNLVSDGVN